VLDLELGPLLRKCSKCGELKAPNEFRKGYRQCHECQKEYNQKWAAANPESRRAACRKYHAANAEKRREDDRKRRAANPEKRRESDARQRYGSHHTEWRARTFAAQHGRCAFCGRTEAEAATRKSPCLVNDHDHVTGELRRLLCSSCNSSYGKFFEPLRTLGTEEGVTMQLRALENAVQAARDDLDRFVRAGNGMLAL
jgi:hypothetical protein